MYYLKKIGAVAFAAYTKMLENLSSKKFMVFIFSSFLLFIDKLPPEYWIPIALAAVGTEALLDWTGAKRRTFDPDQQQD